MRACRLSAMQLRHSVTYRFIQMLYQVVEKSDIPQFEIA
jgi:hypothetical protein